MGPSFSLLSSSPPLPPAPHAVPFASSRGARWWLWNLEQGTLEQVWNSSKDPGFPFLKVCFSLSLSLSQCHLRYSCTVEAKVINHGKLFFVFLLLLLFLPISSLPILKSCFFSPRIALKYCSFSPIPISFLSLSAPSSMDHFRETFVGNREHRREKFKNIFQDGTAADEKLDEVSSLSVYGRKGWASDFFSASPFARSFI